MRDSVGAALSAAFTGAVFALPVVGLLVPATHDLTEVVLEVDRFATLELDPPALHEVRPLPTVAAVIPAPPAPVDRPAEELPEAEEPEETGSEGSDAADGGGPQVAATPDHVADGAEDVADGADEVADGVDEGGDPEGGDAVAEAADLEEADAQPELPARGRAAVTRRVLKPANHTDAAKLALSEVFDEAGFVVGGRKVGRKARCNKEFPEIRPSGEGSWAVERSLVEFYTSSFSRLNSLGWSGRYNEDDGKGWKISGFGCNSPLYHAGLRRGDVVQTVNGRKTRNLLQVYTTWKKLRRMHDFEIVVLRRGEIVTLRYHLI